MRQLLEFIFSILNLINYIERCGRSASPRGTWAPTLIGRAATIYNNYSQQAPILMPQNWFFKQLNFGARQRSEARGEIHACFTRDASLHFHCASIIRVDCSLLLLRFVYVTATGAVTHTHTDRKQKSSGQKYLPNVQTCKVQNLDARKRARATMPHRGHAPAPLAKIILYLIGTKDISN